ncbi:MAG TPA: hypothetical protein VGI60_12515 [Chthoniobacterales bacterium]|jgi:hypothetical protein
MTFETEEARTVPLRHLGRIAFTSFLLTFIGARMLVILIMMRRVPDLFLHLGGTHVHHLNYGIFLLSAVGGLLLFDCEAGAKLRKLCALLYGFGMALTFDEFGMWLHLGGSYWQRASFDAVIVLLGLFGMIAFAPSLSRMRSHHWVTGVTTLVAVFIFYGLLFESVKHFGNRFEPRLHDIEQTGPQ